MTTRVILTILKYASLVVASVVTLLPLGVVLIASLKSKSEFANSGPFDLPANIFNVENFVTAFVKGNMVQGLINTSFILVVSLAGTILIGTMTAYAIDRFTFRAKNLVLGLFNTLAAPIVLFLGTDIISIYIFVQFMQGIPRSLDEAAMIDGANRFSIYARVIFPLLKPAIATVVIIKGIAIYNEFYIPFLYMPSHDLGVISTTLFRFKGPFSAEWEVIAAGVIVVIVPTLIVFLVLQRFIYNGLTTGAGK